MSSEENSRDFSELRAFVAGSLQAIMDGISDVQSTARVLSPFGSGVHAYNAPKEVTFDVAVTAERGGMGKGGFSLKVLSVGANVEGQTENRSSTATRIQFTVRTEWQRSLGS